MAELIPIAVYNLNLQPFQPAAALEEDTPVTIRITSAALDPDSVDGEEKPSTLRMLKRKLPFDDESDDEFLDAESGEDSEEDELDDEESESSEEEKVEKKDDKKKSKDEEESESESEDDEEIYDGEDAELDEEFVICTLSPKSQYQQVLDITIQPDEEVYFVVTGSYPIHLVGNYVEHPDDEDSDEYDSEDEYDSDEYDLTPDEEETYDLDDLEDASDIENKIEELVEEDEKKRKLQDEDSEEEAPKETKKSKKAKKEEKKEDKKGVQFSKELEHGPGAEYGKKEKKEEKKDKKKETKKEEVKEEKKDKKFPTKTLLGGVITEDRKVGKGQTAKSGHKVGIRYIGKLKNGKVFDKNTSGKPFVFGLGKGECIKGFDLGVAGMAVGGERRVVIPPKMGYGSQSLPGIPANSELTFDIKLVSLK